MKRLIAAIALLTVAISFATGAYFAVNKRLDGLIELMERDRELTVYSFSSDSERAREITEEWKKNETFLASMLAHEEIEEIEIGIMNLSDYSEQNFTEEYIKTLNECINNLYHIKETELPETKNIF